MRPTASGARGPGDALRADRTLHPRRGWRNPIETVYLGQYTEDNAESIVERLEAAGIVWWHKQFGSLSQFFFGEWGVRLFVDRARLDEARAIAAEVTGDGEDG